MIRDGVRFESLANFVDVFKFHGVTCAIAFRRSKRRFLQK